mmetsp:Transcript_156597/g.380304  ORF Transcript_156597/g.380304 Transcript_156597/m.380304 type:complete len:255 (-) Transcript_156597:479-1243(-)
MPIFTGCTVDCMNWNSDFSPSSFFSASFSCFSASASNRFVVRCCWISVSCRSCCAEASCRVSSATRSSSAARLRSRSLRISSWARHVWITVCGSRLSSFTPILRKASSYRRSTPALDLSFDDSFFCMWRLANMEAALLAFRLSSSSAPMSPFTSSSISRWRCSCRSTNVSNLAFCFTQASRSEISLCHSLTSFSTSTLSCASSRCAAPSASETLMSRRFTSALRSCCSRSATRRSPFTFFSSTRSVMRRWRMWS